MDAKNRFHAVGDRTQGAVSLDRIEDPGHQVGAAPRRRFECRERHLCGGFVAAGAQCTK